MSFFDLIWQPCCCAPAVQQHELELKPHAPPPETIAGANVPEDGFSSESNPCEEKLPPPAPATYKEPTSALLTNGDDVTGLGTSKQVTPSNSLFVNTKTSPLARHGPLGTVVNLLERAVKLDASSQCVQSLLREPFIEAMDAYASLLDSLGGGMGSYLQTNIDKLKKCQASPTVAEYGPWLLSELPVHKATGYKNYVDNSAFMGNLWLGWTLEFFVALFGHLYEGKETKSSADSAYSNTLRHHHNFLQAAAFAQAVKRLPGQAELLTKLGGGSGVTQEELHRDLGDFVRLARPVVAHCLKLNDDASSRLEEERRKK